jgi:hypothetical protein
VRTGRDGITRRYCRTCVANNNRRFRLANPDYWRPLPR